MRVGIAGTGRIGAMHAEVLAAHPEVDELVVNDAAPGRAAEVATKVGGVAARSIEELLGAGLDALVIATATSAHAELIEAGSDAGISVFCEKPVALDARRTEDVLRHVTASGVPVQIGFQRRFDAGYVAARRALHDGELGELRRVHLTSADPAPPAASFIATSGGIFRDMHIHDFDILRWVTGREVVEVYAAGSTRGAPFFASAGDVDESAALAVLDDGTLATLQGSRYNGAGYDVRMEVAGTRATHVVGLSDRSPVRSTEAGVSFPGGPPWVLFWERFRSAYVAELHAFIDTAAGRRESPCTVADALEAFYLAEAADLSRREHRPVRVDELVAVTRSPH
jgi:myo-inositol 2-dehydrogenase / D-chiro-inositol 1-dehydrogenase